MKDYLQMAYQGGDELMVGQFVSRASGNGNKLVMEIWSTFSIRGVIGKRVRCFAMTRKVGLISRLQLGCILMAMPLEQKMGQKKVYRICLAISPTGAITASRIRWKLGLKE